jgi:hypothetical protein
MQISNAAIGLIVAAGVTAGAGGAFLASRDGGATAPELDRSASSPGSGDGETASTDGAAPETVAMAAPPEPAGPALREPPRARTARGPKPAGVREPRPESPEIPPPAVEGRPAPAVVPEPPLVAESEVPRPIEPAGPPLIELHVSADSVIGLQLDSSITSERARIEDPVEAHVVRDVRVGDRVAIPAGSSVHGEVALVERGGRLKERARLGVRFTSIVLPNGTRLPIQTETVLREGDSQAASSSTKIGGGAIGGAIIGGILGGGKGAAIGGSIGAGAGSAAVMAGGRNEATLPSGAPVTVRIEQPIVVTVEK